MLRKIGDRMLSAMLPKAQANAENCWYVPWGAGCVMEKCCYYPEIQRTYCWCV